MAAATNGLPEDPALLRARLAEVEARYAQSQVQFRELRTWYDKLKRHHRELLWSEAVLTREGLEEAMPGPPIADADRANGHIGGGFVLRHHLGAGAFATVYAAVDKEGRPCAVKRIDKYRIKSLEALRNVAGELRALRAAVGCPNLIWLNGVVASPSCAERTRAAVASSTNAAYLSSFVLGRLTARRGKTPSPRTWTVSGSKCAT